MKITQYPQATTIGGGDVLLLDGAEGTRRINVQKCIDDSIKNSEFTIDKISNVKRLGSPGWYHIAKIKTLSSNGYFYTSNPTFTFYRGYTYSKGEIHKISLITRPDELRFIPILDSSSVLNISKIRAYIIKPIGEEAYSVFVDIYYNLNSGENMTFLINNCWTNEGGKIFGINFEPISENIEELGVLSSYPMVSYTFKANSWMGSEDSWPI